MDATWLGWPVLHDREDLWGSHYAQVCREFALVARTIARYQRCVVAAHYGRPMPRARWSVRASTCCRSRPRTTGCATAGRSSS
ncbi:agmatine deiminase family protein [Burkholderia sp. FXe9]|nr:agmatine deiminase family protein [Burkholderia sp. FXe9]